MTIAQYLHRFKCGALASSIPALKQDVSGHLCILGLAAEEDQLGVNRPCHSEIPRLLDVAPLCLAYHTHAYQFGLR